MQSANAAFPTLGDPKVIRVMLTSEGRIISNFSRARVAIAPPNECPVTITEALG